MWENYFKIALRNLKRNRSYAAINLIGLTVGLALCFVITLFIQHELSYDRFHEKSDRIYRLVMGYGDLGGSARTPAGAASYFRSLPEVEELVRLYGTTEILLRSGEPVKEEHFYYADSSFFDVFSFPLLQGSPQTALEKPNTAVVTQSTARRLFGTVNVLGETLRLRDDETLTVTGVAEDPPPNSHLDFDILTSFSTLGKSEGMSHQSFFYFLLPNKKAASSLQARLDDLTENSSNIGQSSSSKITAHLGFAIEGMSFALQPLSDVHLSPALGGAVQPEGDARYLYIFGAVALFVLLLAAINYMNLATARSTQRAREVGMRKAMGARRSQLAGQFLSEATLFSLTAFVMALGLARLLLPVFNSLSGQEVSFEVASSLPFLALLGGAAILTGLISGSYPALVLSRFMPATVLKGSFRGRTGSRRLRQGLVAFQFAVSIGLIVGTLVVQNQLQYIQNKRLGYDTAEIMTLPLPETADRRTGTLKQELLRVRGVERVSAAWGDPTSYFTGNTEQGGQTIEIHSLPIDYDYVETMGMNIIRGRDFSEDWAADSTRGIIVNETAARAFGLTDKVGETVDKDINLRYEDPLLVGIVSDFHTSSLHESIRPTLLFVAPDMFINSLVLRVDPARLAETLPALEATWNELAPDYPFDYRFLDAKMQSFYESEQRIAGVFGAFAWIAILIACLGLFGLAAYAAERRTKEIGIRKVFGASIGNIVALLSKDFAWLVVIAFVIAAPVAYYAMSRWLEDFAYRIELGPWLFVGAGLLALVIAMATVSSQAIRAALTNPADTLRYE